MNGVEKGEYGVGPAIGSVDEFEAEDRADQVLVDKFGTEFVNVVGQLVSRFEAE